MQKINIQAQADRDAVIIALANNGYACRVERVEDAVYGDVYWVFFDNKQDINIDKETT